MNLNNAYDKSYFEHKIKKICFESCQKLLLFNTKSKFKKYQNFQKVTIFRCEFTGKCQIY